jgi:hypothetical protein
LPRHGLRQQHPAVGETKYAAKKKVQGLNRKLTAMLLLVHFLMSAVADINNYQLPRQIFQ